MPGVNHDWHDLEHYLAIHDRRMAEAEEYFVVSHDLHRPLVLSPTQLRFKGIIHCHGGIEIHVDKILDLDNRNMVRGRSYKYHAQISGSPVMNILRYDTAPHDRDHPDAFHKHVFDDVGNEEVLHVGRQAWPTLAQVIDEVYAWWQDHQR